MRILFDTASISVFAGEGEAVLTSQIFPDPATPTRSISAYANQQSG
ncbi:GH32 C-terminal domain-containing protein [Janthinobacterium lividum]|nr:GH32 C-terminal domain-containing protein [Janthinobacterium lividum]WQE31769.1 GH32 C-terminal domain-containing protein [Janthinobacterium lividum]